MLEFKPLGLEDREVFLKYLGEYKFNTYEYSFSTLYMWRNYCTVEYAVINDVLVIKKTTKKNGSYFMQPVGYKKENLFEIISSLNNIKNNSKDFKYLFGDIEEGFIKELEESLPVKLKIEEDKDNFDYIYSSEALIKLQGKKYHGKKNHFNHFVNNYKYEVREIGNEDTLKDAVAFAEEWYHSRERDSAELKYELIAIEDILRNLAELKLVGIVLYVDGVPAGITVGERINKNMSIIHVEKASPSYNGIYAFLNRTFAEKFLSETPFINREEDLGIEGLRKAKLSYYPVRTEKKFLINLL
jgi:uncharacterized protein